MKSFETIIEQEKKVNYSQRNKQLFSFYTLTLIAQEQAAKRVRRKLLISASILSMVLLLVLDKSNQLSAPINQFLSHHLATINPIGLMDIALMAMASYAMTGLLLFITKNHKISRLLPRLK